MKIIHYKKLIKILKDGFKTSTSEHKLESKVTAPTASKVKSKKKAESDDEGSSEDNEDDYDDEAPMDLPTVIAQKNKGQRTSVSAEAYGKWNQKQEYKPRIINKTELQRSRILKRLEQAFMFASLDEREKNIVIGAMEEKKFNEGEDVIRQGEDGDLLYVVDQGALDCFKKFKR